MSFGAGAVAGMVGFGVFGMTTAMLGTDFWASVAAGSFSGVLAGQAGRFAGLVLSNQVSQTRSVLFRPQDILLDATLGGSFGGLGYGFRYIQLQYIRRILSEAAIRAQAGIGSGSGPAYGSRVHYAFAQEVRALGRSNLFSEVSYLSRGRVDYGTVTSIRVDVVYGTIRNPIAVFDLKTGSATLTAKRILQIQSNLPYRNLPVFEVRP